MGKCILIVDDSPSIRKEVRLILEKEGYEVREAGSEFGMFNSIDEYGRLTDLILMDLMLEEAYGLDLIEKMRKVKRFGSIPVIMLTEHSDRDNVAAAKLIGVQGYIVKPINPGLLKDRVRNILEQTGVD